MTLWEHETLQSIFIPLPWVTLFAFVTLGIITRFPQVFKNSSNTTDNLLRSSYNAFSKSYKIPNGDYRKNPYAAGYIRLKH